MHPLPRGLALCATLASFGCDRFLRSGHDDHAHDHDGHDHAHDDEDAPTRQFTLVADGFELFVEHPLAAAGEPVRFVTHVSHVADGTPRIAGAATLRCRRDGSAPVEARLDAPARPGIYLPELTLPDAGEWSVALELAMPDGPRAIALPPLVVHADAHAALHAEVEPPPEGITFLKEQQWRLRTRVAPATRRPLVEELRVAGFVDAPPAARAQVTAPLAGRLVAAGPWPELGREVGQGELLAYVEPLAQELLVAHAQALAEQAQAAVALEQAQAALARTRTLHQQQARSARELEEAEFAAKAAAARRAAADQVVAAYAQSSLLPRVVDGAVVLPRLPLVAPIDGIVVRVDAVAGEQALPDRALFSLLDPRVLHVEARVPEIDLPRLPDDVGAAYSLPGIDAPPVAITGEGGGHLVWRGVEIDPATRTALLHFSLPDPQRRLRLGQALVVHLTTRTARDALALPESALVDEDGRAVVFVQLGGETFERRDVTPGIHDRGFVEIVAGLAEGERVVVDGAYAVRLASVSASLPAHSHEH